MTMTLHDQIFFTGRKENPKEAKEREPSFALVCQHGVSESRGVGSLFMSPAQKQKSIEQLETNVYDVRHHHHHHEYQCC
jgi:hypothetical protein